MLAGAAPTTAIGSLLLADISGYTRFLEGVGEAHAALIFDSPEPPAAYTVMSSLLEAVVTALVPPFRLAKLEGDAVFAVGTDAELGIGGAAMLERLRACYAAFRGRVADANANWSCQCGSCSRIHALDLKFVLHHGRYVVQSTAGQEEVSGPAVIAAHRLLKNRAHDLLGDRPYALITEAAASALGLPVEGALAEVEQYEHLPPIPVHLVPLDEPTAAQTMGPATALS